MRIKPAMSMFVTVDELNSALAKWYAEENEQLKNTILRFKHLAEVVAQNPGWNDHHCRAQALLNEYAKHDK